jgi:hypothetical protein
MRSPYNYFLRETMDKMPPRPAPAAPATGVFSSLISTKAPLSSATVRQVSAQPQAFRSPGGGAAGQSRDAQARAMADMSRNAIAAKVEGFNRDYGARAEKAMADDRYAQYQTELGRYAMGQAKTQTERQQDQQLQQGMDQLEQYRDMQKRRQQIAFASALTGAVFGTNLLGRLAPAAGEAAAGGASTGSAPTGSAFGNLGNPAYGRTGLLGGLTNWMQSGSKS